MDIVYLLPICFEKLWKDVLWQIFKSHMNKYLISVASRQATKMSVGELIIKLFASSS